jgi:hypothetical protein
MSLSCLHEMSTNTKNHNSMNFSSLLTVILVSLSFFSCRSLVFTPSPPRRWKRKEVHWVTFLSALTFPTTTRNFVCMTLSTCLAQNNVTHLSRQPSRVLREASISLWISLIKSFPHYRFSLGFELCVLGMTWSKGSLHRSHFTSAPFEVINKNFPAFYCKFINVTKAIGISHKLTLRVHGEREIFNVKYLLPMLFHEMKSVCRLIKTELVCWDTTKWLLQLEWCWPLC